MDNLTPAQQHHTSGMDNKSLLYNPNNWFFYGLLLGAFVPAIFYLRNCKMLGKAEEGKKILMMVTGTFLAAMVLSVFEILGSLIGFVFWLGWLFFFWNKTKEQKPLYDERKKNNPEARPPQEWPVVLIFIGIGIVVGILSYMVDSNASLMGY